jgi:hypothetical protein
MEQRLSVVGHPWCWTELLTKTVQSTWGAALEALCALPLRAVLRPMKRSFEAAHQSLHLAIHGQSHGCVHHATESGETLHRCV